LINILNSGDPTFWIAAGFGGGGGGTKEDGRDLVIVSPHAVPMAVTVKIISNIFFIN
jgi:hypothetical protein